MNRMFHCASKTKLSKKDFTQFDLTLLWTKGICRCRHAFEASVVRNARIYGGETDCFWSFFKNGRADKAWFSHPYNDQKNHMYAVCSSMFGVENMSTRCVID